MSQRTRRGYLGLVAAGAAGLAGCSGVTESTAAESENQAQQGTPATTTETETGTAETETGSNGEPSEYTQVYRGTIGSVVSIRVSPSGIGTGGQNTRGSQGSGFVYDQRHVVTNAHVVGGANGVEVQFNRGGSRTGQVVGRDRYADLAAVSIENRPEYATPLSLSDAVPAVGTEAAAIGSPYSLQGSITSGIVSATGRSIPSPAGYSIPNGLQTDAPVNPGNSGGPLVNLDGIVLGVINSGGGENIAFAISAPYAEQVVSALIESGTYEHSYIGVGLVPVTQGIARERGLRNARGLLVRRVFPDTPAQGTLEQGDILVAIDGTAIESQQALSSYLELQARPGDTVTLTLRRNGSRQQVDLTVGTRPPPEQQARRARSPERSGPVGGC
jgi:serine protease Do